MDKSVPTLAVPVKILDALTKLLEFIGFNGAGFRKRQDFLFRLGLRHHQKRLHFFFSAAGQNGNELEPCRFGLRE
jgi:hypothetical protein